MCGAAPAAVARAAANDPIGSFDQAVVTVDDKISVVGWAADPRAPGGRVEVHIYVSGPAGVVGIPGTLTGLPRADVQRAVPFAGGNSGFRATVPNAGIGDNQVCVYAIGSQANPLLGCRSVRVGKPPVGYVDSVAASGAKATVSGWSFDPNRPSVSIPVHIYVTSRSSGLGAAVLANGSRPDVNRAYQITGGHGFTASVALTAGPNTICAYGIGQNGNNALIGSCRTVQGPGGGWPDASNTGVPPGVGLTPSGPMTITTAGTVVDGRDISGGVVVRASNVVIKNSKIHGNDDYGVYVQSGSVTIQDSELWGFSETAVGFSNWTGLRLNIHDVKADGVKFGSNVLLQDSWIHHLTPGSGAHADGGQLQFGARNLTIRHNNIDASASRANAALFIAPDQGPSTSGPMLIESNLLNGGNYTLFCVDGNNGDYFISNITIRNNVFGRNHSYGAASVNVPITQSGNTYTDGTPVRL